MQHVHGIELHQIDLNLLVALDVLIDERHVTRAARRVGISQSAMSHTLRRLRELFGDPLLVRGSSGMVLTPRGAALASPVRDALARLSAVLAEPAPFDPATATRTLSLAAPDLFTMLVVPPLARRLAREAPGITLIVRDGQGAGEKLESGDLDLAVAPVFDPASDASRVELGDDGERGLHQETLFDDRFRCFVRRGHEAINQRRRLTPKRFAELPQVVVSPTGRGPGVVDRALAARGLERRVALRVPLFATALAVVESTDLVLTAPSALAQCATRAIDLAPPLPLPPHALVMRWHARVDADPAHRWLRERVAAEARPQSR